MTREIDLNLFTFPLTVNYASLADKITTTGFGPFKVTEYSKCKGFKHANTAGFKVSLISSEEYSEIYNVTLALNNKMYYFIDKLDKRTGEIARNFILSNQFVTDTIKLTHVVNTDKITPLLRNDVAPPFNHFTIQS